MSVWNKILLFLVFVASLAFFHAALRTIKTFKYWSGLAAAYDLKLAEARNEIVSLRTADEEHPRADKTIGVQQLRFNLNRMVSNRGRIWANCKKEGNVQQEKDGRVEVTVSSDGGNFSDKVLLYVFEEGEEQSPGKYLGEFAIKAINQSGQTSLVLVSTTQPTQIQLKNLRESRATWVLYEMMPADQHELFATLPDELRKKVFPDPTEPGSSKAARWWLPEEYVLDGQTVNGKPFERKLRDYAEVMRVCEEERTLYDDRLNALKRDEGYLEAAKADSQLQENFANEEKARALAAQQWEVKQRQAVTDYYAALRTMLNFNETAVKELIDANARYARQIAKTQKEAAEQIERRTHSMARYGGGVN